MSKNRLCFVVPQLYPVYVGGAEVFNFYLIRELAKIGDVSVLSKSILEDENVINYVLKNTKSIFLLVEIFYLLFKYERNSAVVVSFMRTSWPHIIIYPLLKAIARQKYVIVIHGGGMMKWRFRIPYLLFFRGAEAIYGVSRAICNEYTNRASCRVSLMPPLIPFSRSDYSKVELRECFGIDKSSFIFLVVGSLKEIKRPLLILEGLSRCSRDFLVNNKVHLIFIGDGPCRDKMSSFIRAKKLSDFVTLKGNVDRDFVNTYYKMSDCLIQASKYEGTPIAILEALYNGLIVIGSDVVGIRDTITDGETGFLFESNDSNELALYIKRVVTTDTSGIQDKAKREFRNKYDYKNITDEFLRLLGE